MLITACWTSTRFIYYSQFHSDDSNYFLKLKCQIFSNWQSVILKGKSIHIYLCCSCKSSLLEPPHGDTRIVTLEMQQYYYVKYTTILGCCWAGFVVWLHILSCWGPNSHVIMKGVGGWLLRQMACVNWNVHDARIQEIPEEHRAVMSWSDLVISTVSAFNVVTEQCTCLCLYPTSCNPNHLHILFHSYLIYVPDIYERHKDIRFAGKCSPCLYAHDQALQ